MNECNKIVITINDSTNYNKKHSKKTNKDLQYKY